MVKVIAFSLYGTGEIYLVGAIKNVESAKVMYPDFECWFYIHTETVPKELVEELRTHSNVKIILKSGDLGSCKPKMWRFEAIDDPSVEVMLSRDLDSRFWRREIKAVEQWLQSDKLFHSMRDHPWHKDNVQGGMFGVKKSDIVWKPLMDAAPQTPHWMYDQTFVANVIYPLYRHSMMIHASFHKKEGAECLDFPMTHAEDDYRFVGEYVYPDGSRNAKNREELVRGFL
jgi:hypothetical protein